MRSGEFKERHVVTLNDEQRATMARKATRQAQALERQIELAAREEAAWDEAKDVRKKRIAELDEARKKMEADLFLTSNGVESGRMEMEVRCREEMVGVKVITLAIDTMEQVAERDANERERQGREPVVPGGGAAHAKGYTEEERTKKIEDGLEKLLAKPRAEGWLLGKLAKGVPEATPEQIKAVLIAALEQGRIVEDDGKLALIKLRADVIPGEPDDGVVPDDYQPTAH